MRWVTSVYPPLSRGQLRKAGPDQDPRSPERKKKKSKRVRSRNRNRVQLNGQRGDRSGYVGVAGGGTAKTFK